MALTCGPGLSAAEGATVVEVGSAAAAVQEGKQGRRKEARGLAVAGLARREKGQQAQMKKEGKKGRAFFFFFSINFPIPFLIPILFEILIDTKHSQNNMQRHECTYMLLLYDKF